MIKPPDHIRALARDMLRELRQSRQTVVLVPAPRPKHAGHKIRLVEERLPAWYLCALSQRCFWRKEGNGTGRWQSSIHRSQVVASLERIAKGEAMPRSNSIDGDMIGVIELEHRSERDAHAG